MGFNSGFKELMAEGEKVEQCILYKIPTVNILPENGNTWHACEV